MASDLLSAVKAALSELESKPSQDADKDAALRIRDFKNKAMDILNREKAYPNVATVHPHGDADPEAVSDAGEEVLSVVGYAPHERRLFSSLPLARGTDPSKLKLPPDLSVTRVAPSTPREKTQTLGEIFAPPRPLPPLQPPKQPKTQAKGNVLDFYHPELTDTSKYRTNCYYTTKLTAGHYLDYSNATPSSRTKTKQRERAQSLAGKKPSASELEMTEMEALFRGAFSSFAPCKDDAAAVVPSSVAGRMWWQKSGQRSFQRMIEIECYGDVEDADAPAESASVAELDEVAVQEAIDNWDDSVIDPTLEDVMAGGRHQGEKEAEEILDEVSDMIETLASYQRIRNLTLPNSQNRQSSDPVTGDMLATAGPQPSEEEHATYEMLKAQLALIIKTLPPYAVAKLNGDQLDDLLISTKVQVQTDQYRGVMEEDDVGLQARMRAQQQQQVSHAPGRHSSQRTPSISTPYGNKYQAPNQYGTPTRPPAHPQQYYRPSPAPNYQQPRNMTPSAHQARPPPPNQYTRPNGYPNQYATQLAKAQTPYGHQNMPVYAGQPRPGYAQMPLQPGQPQPGQPPAHQHAHQPQQGNPNARYAAFPQAYPQQQGTPGQPGYGAAYTNGSSAPPRTISPQVPPRPPYSPSPNMTQNQRFSSQGNAPLNRYPGNAAGQPGPNQNPGLTGYHTVIPEAQQQRILDQAKARVAAQERTAMFTDKVAHPGASPGMGYGSPGGEGNKLAAPRSSLANQQKPSASVGQRQGSNGTPGASVPPHKVTPVPVPVIPGAGQQQQRRKSDA